MPIALVGDKLHASANWMRASKSARGLWATALSWCASQGRYDGRVPRHILRGLGATARDADNLVAAGLWGSDGDDFLFLEHFGIRRTGPRADIPTAVRVAVYERDGYSCVTCGSSDDLSLDHIKPWSLGGPDTVENFQTMCRPCNSSKGAQF